MYNVILNMFVIDLTALSLVYVKSLFCKMTVNVRLRERECASLSTGVSTLWH